MDEQQLQLEIIETLAAGLLPETSFALFKAKLVAFINQLINNDLEKLIFLLYKVDVDENKLKLLIAGAPDAAATIADLVIDRQIQKIRSRETFRSNGNIDEEEKW